MRQRQTVFPTLSRDLIRAFGDEPILIDGMKLEFDERVALYPAAVELTEAAPATRSGGDSIAPASNGTRNDARNGTNNGSHDG